MSGDVPLDTVVAEGEDPIEAAEEEWMGAATTMEEVEELERELLAEAEVTERIVEQEDCTKSAMDEAELRRQSRQKSRLKFSKDIEKQEVERQERRNRNAQKDLDRARRRREARQEEAERRNKYRLEREEHLKKEREDRDRERTGRRSESMALLNDNPEEAEEKNGGLCGTGCCTVL